MMFFPPDVSPKNQPLSPGSQKFEFALGLIFIFLGIAAYALYCYFSSSDPHYLPHLILYGMILLFFSLTGIGCMYTATEEDKFVRISVRCISAFCLVIAMAMVLLISKLH